MIKILKEQYGRYRQDAAEARQKAGLCDGLFGFGNDPRKHPCHDSFYEAVGQWTAEFIHTEPSPDACAEAVDWILRAADSCRDQESYWYLYAAQAHALPLIPYMTREDSRTLLDWYGRAYPARDRMPIQEQVYRALKKASIKNFR